MVEKLLHLVLYLLLKFYNIDLDEKNVVIVGKGKSVGRPLINLLLNEGATVTVCHSRTTNIKKHTIDADIVISAIDIKNIITADMIKEGAIVIDAGYSLEKDELYGDVDFTKVSKKASLITPQKDGVETMAIAMFLKNIILCYNNKK